MKKNISILLIIRNKEEFEMSGSQMIKDIHNHEVAGSIPAPATKRGNQIYF